MPMSRLLAVAALLIVAGCSGSSTGYGGNPPPPPPPPPPPGPTLAVTVGNNSFSPSNGSVTNAGTVTWTWAAGAITHNVTFETGPDSSGSQGSGSYQRTFPTVASNTTFRYRCTLHSTSFAAGMIGQVVVTP